MNQKCLRGVLALSLALLALTASAEEDGGSLFMSGPCATTTGPSYVEAAAMREKIGRYQLLVEENLSLRARAIDFFGQLTEKMDAGQPLSGGDLRRLNDGAAELLAQREALLAIASEYECWVKKPIPADRETALQQASGIAMSVSSALLLYDNYMTVVGLYRSNATLRRHLNRQDSGFALPAGEVDHNSRLFNSAVNRARVRTGLSWLAQHGAILSQSDDDEARYLAALIEQSPARQMVKKVQPFRYASRMIGLFGDISVDTLNSLKNEGVNLFSLLFGNAVGLVETRHGKLYGRAEVQGAVQGDLRAGDILLEKTPFRLTDNFIPGHWGHAAIWVGSEDELRRLGIWEHPAVRPHQAAIREGRGVVEALRAGVQINTLAHFLNVDDLAVLRHGAMDDGQRAEVIVQTLRQVGKAYDFNFDVETTDRIVCSELIYHAYGDIRWPVARHFGRATISPDNIAAEAVGDGPFSVIALYHDGKAVSESPRQRLAELVRTDVVRVAHGGAAGP